MRKRNITSFQFATSADEKNVLRNGVNGKEITVPHTWNVEDGNEEYCGTGWYSTEFETDASAFKTVLAFRAVYRDCTVYLNGQEIAKHLNSGFTPFEADITDKLQVGKNLLVVKCSNAYSNDALSHGKDFDWANDGGILRPVDFMEYSEKDVRHFKIESTVKDLEKHGVAEWVGYSVAWMAQLYIVQGNGEKACALLRSFFTYNCTDNGFHINGDYKKQTDFHMKYRLFTLEGNFLATDALQNMLLYSEWGKVRLFPAVPNTWQNIEFQNFRAFGGLLVSGKMETGKITYVKITATADVEFTLENDLSHLTAEPKKNFTLQEGETIVFA